MQPRGLRLRRAARADRAGQAVLLGVLRGARGQTGPGARRRRGLRLRPRGLQRDRGGVPLDRIAEEHRPPVETDRHAGAITPAPRARNPAEVAPGSAGTRRELPSSAARNERCEPVLAKARKGKASAYDAAAGAPPIGHDGEALRFLRGPRLDRSPAHDRTHLPSPRFGLGEAVTRPQHLARSCS